MSKSENISPLLAGEMTRAVVAAHYPVSFLPQLTSRIGADGDNNGLRIALIKAVLQRCCRKGLIKGRYLWH
nr:type I-C CRISPR-associated protein Cas8c/Csd1 [Neisseria iguanae]